MKDFETRDSAPASLKGYIPRGKKIWKNYAGKNDSVRDFSNWWPLYIMHATILHRGMGPSFFPLKTVCFKYNIDFLT